MLRRGATACPGAELVHRSPSPSSKKGKKADGGEGTQEIQALDAVGKIYEAKKAFELPSWAAAVPFVVVAIYLVALAALQPYCDGQPLPGLQRDASGGYVLHSAQIAHCVSMVSFAVTLLLCIAAYAWVVNPFKRLVSLCVCTISAVALATYTYFVFYGVPYMLAKDGQSFEPVRYLQWLFTTPCMIFAISCFTEINWSNGKLRGSLEADLAMVVFGFLDRFCGPPLRYVWFVLSCAAFLRTMHQFHQVFVAAQGVMVDEMDRHNLKRVHVFTFFTWSLFPLVRVASIVGYVDDTVEDIATTCLNLSAKLIYAVSLMVVSFTVMDQLLEKRLEAALRSLQPLLRDQAEQLHRVEEDAGAVAAAQTVYDRKLLAYSEAVAWRAQREAALRDDGYPAPRAAALLDSTLNEYIALSAGNISAYLK